MYQYGMVVWESAVIVHSLLTNANTKVLLYNVYNLTMNVSLYL